MLKTFQGAPGRARVFTLCSLMLAASCTSDSDGAANARAISVVVTSDFNPGESFKFLLRSETLTITQKNIPSTFNTRLAQGESYQVSETAGPRICVMTGQQGTVGATDILVTANCGPVSAQHRVRVRVTTPIGSGESFSFALTGAQQATAVVNQQNVVTDLGPPLAQGDSWQVLQTAGPRTCRMTPNGGQMADADVLVDADCGGASQGGQVTGVFRGPVDAQVTLLNNGADSLPVKVTATSADPYDATKFTFPTPLAGGSSYAVTIANKPANQTCSVYANATGTVPTPADAVKVGCEYTFDHVSRSTNNAVLATRVEAFVPVIGGADVAVGGTTTPYGEGRFVAFVSSAATLSPNGQRQVFWRDRFTGETRLVSANAAGTPGNGQSDRPAISADGTVVAFESLATNLVASDGNGLSDVFVWSIQTGGIPHGIQRVSLTAAGGESNGNSTYPTISGDGRIVAFTCNGLNMTAGAGGDNVIRRDVVAGTNTIVSVNGSGTAVGGAYPALSEDGNRLAFWSFSSQVVTGDGNGLWDIFVYQHSDGSRRRVTLRSDGGERDQGTESTSRGVLPAISGDGHFVAFATTSTNVVPNDTNGMQDVFVVDLDGPLGMRRASVSASGQQGDSDSPGSQGERVALSYDGTWIAFTSTAKNFGTTVASGTNVFLRNLLTNETRAITDSTFGTDVVTMSRRGAYLAFGAAQQLDSRFASTGLFAHFTGITRAWWWVD